MRGVTSPGDVAPDGPSEQPVAPPDEPEPQPLTRVARREAERARRSGSAGASAAAMSSEPASAAPSGDSPAESVTTPHATWLTTVGLALLVALSAAVGQGQLGVAVAFSAVVVAWGWAALTDAPDAQRATAVVGAGGVAIAATAALTRTEPFLGWVPAAVGVSVIVAFLQQVTRGVHRPRLADGVASSVAGLALSAAAAPMIVLPLYRHGADYVAVAMAAVAVGAAAELLDRVQAIRRWVALPALALATAAAVGTAAALGGIPLLAAAGLGLVTAGVSYALRRVLLLLPHATGLPARCAVGAGSVLVVGVLVYLVARVVAS